MRYKVVISTLIIDGKKHRRGDVIELDNGEKYGVMVEPYVEAAPKVEQKTVKRRARSKKVSDEG